MLSWTLSEVQAASQEVYRSLTSNPAEAARIATISAATRNFTDNTAANGTAYYYWIKATEAGGAVTTSNVVSAMPVMNFEGTFVLVAAHSGKAVDVANASVANGGNIVQNTANGANSQKWVFRNLGTGYYSIRNSNSGKSLDVSSASTAAGANILQWDENGGNNQQWQIMTHANGRYSILARHSGHAIEVSNGSQEDGANVQQGAYATTKDFQQFTLVDPATVTSLADASLSQAGTLLYPNPSTGAFTVEQQGSFSYVIYDYLGREVEQGNGNNSIRTGASLKPGLYIIHVKSEHTAARLKLIKR